MGMCTDVYSMNDECPKRSWRNAITIFVPHCDAAMQEGFSVTSEWVQVDHRFS